MITIKRTNSNDIDFQELVRELDIELKEIDGEEHMFYNQFNKTVDIKYALIACENDIPVGCGAIKEYTSESMEVKRMYVKLSHRGKGIASMFLKELEIWSSELGYSKCILETGKRQPQAIRLYEKNNYKQIPNYGQYKNVENSVCFEKEL
jgi:putative acetyltransferase